MIIVPRIHSILKSTVEIIPHVYQLTITGVNVILIAEEELTLIDTAYRGSTNQIVDSIHKLGRSVEEISLIILTHNHLDHVGGLSELRKLTRAKVAAHQADISDTENQLSYPRVLQKTLRAPPFSNLHSVFSVVPDEIDIQLEGDEVLKPLNGLKVIHTPGHTPGSICLFSPQNRMLIVGDALNRRGNNLRPPLKMVSTDRAQALDSVKKIAELDFDILCFGHGQPLTRHANTKIQKLIEKIKD